MNIWIPVIIAGLNVIAGFFHGKQAQANKQSAQALKDAKKE